MLTKTEHVFTNIQKEINGFSLIFLFLSGRKLRPSEAEKVFHLYFTNLFVPSFAALNILREYAFNTK